MTALRVGALRPYSARIRSRVFATLDALGAEVEVLAPAGASDDQAMQAVRRANVDVLLVPFNAHRDAAGGNLNGLSLIERIRSDPSYNRVPILCPISNVGLAAADLATSRRKDDGFSAVLFLREDELSSPNLVQTIAEFLREHGIRKRFGQ